MSGGWRQGRQARLGDVLRDVLPQDAGGLPMGLRERWSELVGERMAAHLRPVALRHGELWLSADSPRWAQQLPPLEGALITRLQQAGFPIQRVLAIRPRA